MTLTPHFTLEEMTRSSTATRLGLSNAPPLDVVDRMRLLCRVVLENVRVEFGPIRILSGYRCPALNQAVGGSQNSQHTRGEAVDFVVPGTRLYAVAVWMRDHTLYDQLILEFWNPEKEDAGWIHVSYSEGNNRRQTLAAQHGPKGVVYTPWMVANL